MTTERHTKSDSHPIPDTTSLHQMLDLWYTQFVDAATARARTSLQRHAWIIQSLHNTHAPDEADIEPMAKEIAEKVGTDIFREIFGNADGWRAYIIPACTDEWVIRYASCVDFVASYKAGYKEATETYARGIAIAAVAKQLYTDPIEIRDFFRIMQIVPLHHRDEFEMEARLRDLNESTH